MIIYKEPIKRKSKSKPKPAPIHTRESLLPTVIIKGTRPILRYADFHGYTFPVRDLDYATNKYSSDGVNLLDKSVNPDFGNRVEPFLDEVQEQLPGYTVKAAEVFRSPEQQQAMADKGASKAKIGLHNFGEALDMALLTPEGKYAFDKNNVKRRQRRHIRKILRRTARKYDLVWGGNWKFRDVPHVSLYNTVKEKIRKEGNDALKQVLKNL